MDMVYITLQANKQTYKGMYPLWFPLGHHTTAHCLHSNRHKLWLLGEHGRLPHSTLTGCIQYHGNACIHYMGQCTCVYVCMNVHTYTLYIPLAAGDHRSFHFEIQQENRSSNRGRTGDLHCCVCEVSGTQAIKGTWKGTIAETPHYSVGSTLCSVAAPYSCHLSVSCDVLQQLCITSSPAHEHTHAHGYMQPCMYLVSKWKWQREVAWITVCSWTFSAYSAVCSTYHTTWTSLLRL